MDINAIHGNGPFLSPHASHDLDGFFTQATKASRHLHLTLLRTFEEFTSCYVLRTI